MPTRTSGVFPTAASSTSTGPKSYREVLRQLYKELDACRVKALEEEQDKLSDVIELLQGTKNRTTQSGESLLLRLQELLSDQHGQEANERIRAQIKAKFAQAATQFHRIVDEYVFYSRANAWKNFSTQSRYSRDLTARPIQQSIEVGNDGNDVNNDNDDNDDPEIPVQDDIVNQDYMPSRAPTPEVIETTETRNDSARTKKRKRPSKASSSHTSSKTRANKRSSRPATASRKKHPRAAASASKPTKANKAADITTALSKRTARFEDVFQNGSAPKKYQIAEIDGHFYYVSCDIHDESFLDKKDSFKSANGHLKEHLSSMNKTVKKVCFETMLPHLGVHIVDCTRKDAIRNNRVRQLAIAASKAHCAEYGGKATPLSIQQVTKPLIEKYRLKKLVPWESYAAFLGQSLSAIVAVALPVDGPTAYLQKLHDTITQPFWQNVPACVLFCRDTLTFGGWAPGYRDGEEYVKDRLYPVLGFDAGQHLHNRILEWVSLADDVITPFDEHNTGCPSKRDLMLQFVKNARSETIGNDDDDNDDANSGQSSAGSPVQNPTLTDPHVDRDMQQEEAPPESAPQPSANATPATTTTANSAGQVVDDYMPDLGDMIGDSPPTVSYDYRDLPPATSNTTVDEHPQQSATVESSNSANRIVTLKLTSRHSNPQNTSASWITANRISPLQGRQPEAVMDTIFSATPLITEYPLPSN